MTELAEPEFIPCRYFVGLIRLHFSLFFFYISNNGYVMSFALSEYF